jgi:hypothetical protein
VHLLSSRHDVNNSFPYGKYVGYRKIGMWNANTNESLGMNQWWIAENQWRIQTKRQRKLIRRRWITTTSELWSFVGPNIKSYGTRGGVVVKELRYKLIRRRWVTTTSELWSFLGPNIKSYGTRGGVVVKELRYKLIRRRWVTTTSELWSFVGPNIKSYGTRGGVVVKALHYKPAGRGFDSRWYHWNFSVT